MEYRAKYVCRLCGGVDCSTATTNKELAFHTAITVAVNGIDAGKGVPVSLHHVHSCPDGGFGISDFHGFVAIPEE